MSPKKNIEPEEPEKSWFQAWPRNAPNAKTPRQNTRIFSILQRGQNGIFVRTPAICWD
jgi:hypothetical protein